MKTKLPERQEKDDFSTTEWEYETVDELTVEISDAMAAFVETYQLFPEVIMLPMAIKGGYMVLKELNNLKMDGLLFGAQVFFCKGDEIIIGSKYGNKMQRVEDMHERNKIPKPGKIPSSITIPELVQKTAADLPEEGGCP